MIVAAADLEVGDMVDLKPVLSRYRMPVLGYQPDSHLRYLMRMAGLRPFQVVSTSPYNDERARVVRVGVNVDGGRDVEYFHLSLTEHLHIQTRKEKPRERVAPHADHHRAKRAEQKATREILARRR